jgi:glycosyltransferase involved in cell wall biosynthesis
MSADPKVHGPGRLSLSMIAKNTNRSPYADLSVVIITRNEAKNIARAVESVLRALEQWPQTEILLVDSASTDATVEIARRYPINIVRLDPAWFRSVSAGRHIGMRYTRGELVLHMDGDMELDPDWVNRSVSYMLEHPEAGAVGGYWRNVYLEGGQIAGEEDEYRSPHDRPVEASYVGGAALYRRCAIEAMGGFQPFIKGEEGVYLSMGIRHAGYKVVLLPYLMSRHYCIPRQSFAGSLRKVRLGFVLGYGQVLRSYWGTGLFGMYLKERGVYTMVYFAGVLISFICLLLTLLSRNIVFLAGWLLMVAMVILGFAFKKRSLRQALLSCLIQTWVAYGVARGFLLPPRSSAEYPTAAEIVQVRYQRGGLSGDESAPAIPIQKPERVEDGPVTVDRQISASGSQAAQVNG